MSDSICCFLPTKEHEGDIKTMHFVYETDFCRMEQPFLRSLYYAHVVTAGSAELRFCGKSVRLSVGSLFIFFPEVSYEMEGTSDFRYIYISFMGAGVSRLFDGFGINPDNSVFDGFSHVIDIWMSSISRVNGRNANVLAEGVLLYTLSFLAQEEDFISDARSTDSLLKMITDYVDIHYRDCDITLKRVAEVFSYSDKYLSHFFKKHMSIGFNGYINNLRLKYAHKLISEGKSSVSEIAANCGFGDPLYFSKVFKKSVGYSPSEYIKSKAFAVNAFGEDL